MKAGAFLRLGEFFELCCPSGPMTLLVETIIVPFIGTC